MSFSFNNRDWGDLRDNVVSVCNKFGESYWRELDNENTYYSEDYRGFIMNYRATFNTLVRSLIDNGEYEKALEVIHKSLELIPDKSIMYDHFSVQLVEFLLKLDQIGDIRTEELANEIAEITSKRADEILNYYFDNKINNKYEIQRNLVSLNTLARAYSNHSNKELSEKYRNLFEINYEKNP